MGRTKVLSEHDTVALVADLPAESLRRGDVGAIVHCYHDGRTIEVEFIDERGRTKSVFPPIR
jgi:hypothetical protein